VNLSQSVMYHLYIPSFALFTPCLRKKSLRLPAANPAILSRAKPRKEPFFD